MSKHQEIIAELEIAKTKVRKLEEELTDYIRELLNNSQYKIGSVIQVRGVEYRVCDYAINRDSVHIYGNPKNKHGEFTKQRRNIEFIRVRDIE